MYEENLEPLPPGNALEVFASELADIQQHCDLEKSPVSRDGVLSWADTGLQELLKRISRRLLLPGSKINGIENLQRLVEFAEQGQACILCLNHRSNLDVPTLAAMLQDHSNSELFHKIIWIAGRKLQEDRGLTGILVQGFNRIIVTPPSWSEQQHTPAELEEARLINLAAHRIIHELREQGWVFALFPTGTRIRPGDKATTQAIPETDGYLKTFDQMVLANIEGCTLPVARDQDLTREIPKLDRICYTFGPVQTTEAWRATAANRFPQLDQRSASARAIMDDISKLADPKKV